MSTTLLLGGRLPSVAGATALAIVDGTVTWTGDDSTGWACFGDADDVLKLRGALVTPAFVDAHVHATSAGLLAGGLDLIGCPTLAQCLDQVAQVARPGTVLWGHGWDETLWPERRPPTRAELDRASGGAAVYLSRVDVHSAAVSSGLLQRSPEAVGAPGWAVQGALTREAHHHARRAARESITPGQRRDAQRAFLTGAAARGIAVVHECAGPDISGIDDLADLLTADHGVEVIGYWGQAVTSPGQARELLAATGAHGLAGDLCCDGAIGSRTAALRTPYADAPDICGVSYLDAEQIAAHVVACTQAGTQAGFHTIGDAAADAVVAGFATAEATVGATALRQCTHRLEHLEMVDPDQARQLARWGVVASVQPAFDAVWGGRDGMYALRLGASRAAAMNPYALLAAAGVVLAFGSDAPVTPIDPWGAVRAAVEHRSPGSGIGVAEALAAHTRGGYRAAATAGPLAGTLAPGAPASYAIWDGSDPPSCLRTVHRSRILFEREGAGDPARI
ncbi:MAG TPA: amidohydrolase family protein [Pseudonocardiaceae bacterium]|jgi:predicted amidohydrolase YtcJ|nr:amidohydrolase family protein [Pseudonocardiaceae bacterium]